MGQTAAVPPADPREVLGRAAPPPRLTVSYGPLPEHVADIWLPPGSVATASLVVVVHGGFWRAEHDRRHTRPQCAGLAAAGHAVAAIEYRRVGAGGGWPTTFDDVARALSSVPGLVATAAAGIREVDVRRVVHVGHSAGAHLAVWAASRHRLAAASPWRVPAPDPALAGVVSLAGVLDLVGASDLDLDRGAARALLGGGPAEVPSRYEAADPLRLAPSGVPTVLLHGTADDRVPPSFSRRYAAAAGPGVSLVELPGVEHFRLIDPQSPAWPAVLAAVAGLLAPAGHHPP